MMSSISVLMAVYKNETGHRLGRCLDSVWTIQSRKPNQIILVEDGPLTPELYDVVEKYRVLLGDSLIVHKNPSNLGLTKSLNIGLQYINGDYIARIDSDDYCDADRFQIQSEFLDEHPEIDVVGGFLCIVDSLGREKYVKSYKETHEEMMREIGWICPLAHPAVMMRSSLFLEKGLSYNERFRNSQDIALWVDAIMAGCKFYNIQKVMVYFTEDEGVYQRRGKVRAKNELISFSRAARFVYGKYSPKRILPYVRYFIRRMPVGLIKRFYNSKAVKKRFGV
jgi:glycosyltransferase involved in cell wall biosynthesis